MATTGKLIQSVGEVYRFVNAVSREAVWSVEVEIERIRRHHLLWQRKRSDGLMGLRRTGGIMF